MIEVFDSNGNKLEYSAVLSNLPITESCEHVEELMKSDHIVLSWRDSVKYTLPVGAYITYKGVNYALLEPYEPEQKSEDTFEYTPNFQHPKMYLGKVPFRFPTKDTDGNDITLLDWPYSGDIDTLLTFFCRTIETELGLAVNTFNYSIQGEIDSIISTTFSSVDILSALTNVANQLKCEWHIDWDYKILYVGHIKLSRDEVEETVLEVGVNVGTPSVRSSKEGFYNTYEPQGSTRNITKRAASGEYVQGDVRLSLNEEDFPDKVIYTNESGTIIDSLPDGQKAYVKPLIFDDIFPKLDLYVYDVRCRERYLLDDKGDKIVDHYEGSTPIYKRYAVWYMRLAYPTRVDGHVTHWNDYTINPETDIISGKSLGGAFQPNKYNGAESFPLAGRGQAEDGGYGFELNYHTRAESIPSNPTDGDTGVEIKVGDYEIVFQEQNDYILPTTASQGIIPKGVKVDGHEVTNLNALSNLDDGQKGNIVDLYNIVINSAYTKSAQDELASETRKYIVNQFKDNNSYTLKSDAVAFKKKIDQDETLHTDSRLYIGKKVVYKNGSYELETRVMKLTTKLDFAFVQEIVVGNEVLKGTQTTLKEQVQTILSGGVGGSGVDSGAVRKIVQAYTNPRFLSKLNDDTAAGFITMLKGLQVGANFIPDILGEGGVLRMRDDGKVELVTDILYARVKAYFDSVEIRKYQHTGGNRIASVAGNKICRVAWFDSSNEELEQTQGNLASVAYFRCYFRASDGEDTVRNNWVVGDQAYCHITSVTTGSDNPEEKGLNQKHLWRLVIGRNTEGTLTEDGEAYIDLSNRTKETISSKDYTGYQSGSDIPTAQDDIIQLGNVNDTTRQGAIVEFVTGTDAPSYQIYQGINSFSLNGKNQIGFGYNTGTGRAYLNVYGDFRFGSRPNTQGSYIAYNQQTGNLDIKANVTFTNTREMSQFVKDNQNNYDDSKVKADIAMLDATTQDLQKQIDGAIETWFMTGVPTLQNAPANEWTTDDEKDKHIGDLYYDKVTGHGYRFMYDDEEEVYLWTILTDEDVTEALRLAAQAQETADGKRTVYSVWGAWMKNNVNTLEVGDLFIPNTDTEQGTKTYKAKKVYKCNTDGVADFEEIAYTDDTTVERYMDILANGMNNPQTTKEIALATEQSIRNALGGATVLAGGLMLTSLIGLRQFDGGDASDYRNYTTWAGISGQYKANALGRGIAAWYGGDMVDKEALSAETIALGWGTDTGQYRWAKSLDRFDGSGYRANGNISWTEDGALTIKNITTLSDSNNKNILNELATFNSAFTFGTDGEGSTTALYITPQVPFKELYIGTSNANKQEVATKNWVNQNFVTTTFFDNLFRLYNGYGNSATQINVNGTLPTDKTNLNIEAMFGFWTKKYISALGQGDDGTTSYTTLAQLNDVTLTNPTANQILVYDGTHWRNQNQQSVYELPVATTTTLGGIKVGTTLAIASGVLNLPTTGVTAGTYKRVTVDAYGRVTSGDNTDTDTNTWRNIYVGGTSKVGTGIDTKAINFKAGSNVSISYAAAGTGSGQSGNANYFDVVISATDTTYSSATQSAAGLMSAYDKKKLDGVAANANNYSLPLATSGTRGGVQIGFTTDAANRNYAVQLSSEKMYVNVPWENTWRGIQNNLTSQSTTDSLSAYQGYLLANGSARDNTKLPLSGGTMTGKLQVNAPIVGYNYSQQHNAAAFIFDKSGSNWTGIGANGEADTIYFSACGSEGAWVNDYKQIWKFNGNIKADKVQIGSIELQYDSTNNAIKVVKSDGAAASLYATGGVSALGMSEDGSAGAGDVTWALLASNSDTRQIALSHLTTSLTTITGGTTDSTNKKYAVYKNSSNQLFVDVPWTAGSGTVTSVKVGSTSYTPTNGVISLPAYPTVPTKVSQLTNDSGYITSYTNTWRNIYVSGTEKLTTAITTKGLNFAAGSNVSLSFTAAGSGTGQNSNYGTITISATDTTYESKAAASGGTAVSLVTTGEKYTWNSKAAGNHTHTTSIATSTAANQLTLAFGTKYAITAGGTSYVFTMPSNPNTNTTYTFATGDSNGQIKVTPSSGSAYNVSVKGLGSAAYLTADTSASNSTVAQRTANGYLFATYFNQSSGTKTPTESSYWLFADSDGYFRKSTRANLESTIYPYEAKLQWGGRNFSDSYGCIDAAMVPELGANRAAFCPASAISIQYSTNGGSSWTDYGASDAQKRALFSGVGTGLAIGKNTSAGVNYTNYRLRVIINTGSGSIYSVLNKFVIYISTNGSSGTWCTIDARLQSNVESGTDTWTTFASQVGISGWSGYNVINTSRMTTYRNTKASQYGQIRFTFGNTGYSSSYSGMRLHKIFCFGGVGWATPSTMAKTGHLYSYNENQRAFFPEYVSASGFIKSGSSDSYVLLGGGGHAAISGLSVSYASSAGSANSVAWTNVSSRPTKLSQFTNDSGFVTSSGVTRVATGTGLTGGTITTSGTISINSTYQTYISHGESAYGWGNHANAGYAAASSLGNYLPKSGGTMTGNLTMGLSGASIRLYTGDYQFGCNDTDDFYIWSTNNSARFRIGTNNLERLTVLTNGNVGIGTQSPSYTLDVNGTARANNYLTSSSNGSYVQIGAIRLVYDSTNNAIKVIKSDGTNASLYATGGLSALGAGQESGGGSIATSAYRLANTYTENTRPSSANVSYGDGCVRYFLATSSMSVGKPTMEDSSILHLAWDNSGWDKQIAFGHGTHGYLQYRSQNSGVWSDWNTIVQMVGDSTLCINHTGSNYGEGIRLANKNGKTHTWSEINFGCDASTTAGTHTHQWTVGRNGNNDYFVIRNYDTNRFSIDLNGNVYIGDGNPSYKLHVSGTVGATGFTNTSDIRKKNRIKDVDLRLDQIAKAPAFEYYWLDPSIDHDLHVGTSAQYWESVLPQVVTTAKDEMGTKAMQYGVAALISAITVARKVMTHEEKIALLETRVSALEKENGEQEMLINSLQEELSKFKAA